MQREGQRQGSELSRSRRAVTRVVSVTSGKGGVGKTNCAVNLALALARLGRSCMLLDADLGLANVNVLLGLHPHATLADVLDGRMQLRDIMLHGPEGVAIVPAASGAGTMNGLSAEQKMLLMSQIEEVASEYDYLLIDTQAGIGPEVMYFNSAAAEIVCVINGEPTSLTDAYALIKVLSAEYGEKNISIIANNVQDEAAGRAAFGRLSRAVDRFLHVNLAYLGCVPSDLAMRTAVTEQKAFLQLFPSSAAARALCKVAERIDADFYRNRIKGGMQFFFKQLMEASAYGC